MITMTKVDACFARLDAPEDVKTAIVRMVEHAVDIYGETELDVLILWKAEVRFGRFRRLAEQLAARDEDSFDLDRDQFVAVRMVMDQLEDREIPGVSAELRDSVVRQVLQVSAQKTYDEF